MELLLILEELVVYYISEISHEHIETPHNILNVNDQMKVMIIDLDSERGRISLSTKALEPEPGDMLTDPQKYLVKLKKWLRNTSKCYLSKLMKMKKSPQLLPKQFN